MRRIRTATEEERRLWREVTREVRPLRPPAVPEPPVAAEAAPAPVATPPAAAPRRTRQPAPGHRQAPLRTGDLSGIDGHRADRLRRGRAAIEARIDLHGMRRDEAHAALVGFISHAHGAGRRTVLVITGKGRFGGGSSVLRGELPRWLNEAPLRPLVLAFSQAHPTQGGGGAFYIVLKRRREAG